MEEEITQNGYVSDPISSSPPSPLPISVGPGNRKYSFSQSPTPSPPFSPPPSSHTSAINLPLLLDTLSTPARVKVPSSFSLDRKVPDNQHGDRCSCLEDLLDWFLQRCCGCFSWSPQILHQRPMKIHSS